MGNSSSSQVASRLRTQKVGSHLEREQKAMEKLKQIREKESNDYDHAVKVQQKLAANAVWTDVGDDFEKNFIQPLKKYSGITLLQECSQPKAHIDSDEEEELQEPKPPIVKKPGRRTTRERVQDMVRDHHPDFRAHDED